VHEIIARIVFRTLKKRFETVYLLNKISVMFDDVIDDGEAVKVPKVFY